MIFPIQLFLIKAYCLPSCFRYHFVILLTLNKSSLLPFIYRRIAKQNSKTVLLRPIIRLGFYQRLSLHIIILRMQVLATSRLS